MTLRNVALATLLAGCVTAGCLPKPGETPAEKKKVIKGKPPSKPKVNVRLDPYSAMDKVQGTVTSPGPGAVTLGICTVREWARCKAEKRPPIPADTVTVQFGNGRDGRFRFDKGDAMVPPFFVFSTPESECRIDPIQVKGKDGPALW